MHLEDLPTEILVNIISLLPLDSLLTLSEVSKYFYTLVNSELQSGKIPIDLEINEDFYQKQPKVSYEINQIGKKINVCTSQKLHIIRICAGKSVANLVPNKSHC